MQFIITNKNRILDLQYNQYIDYQDILLSFINRPINSWEDLYIKLQEGNIDTNSYIIFVTNNLIKAFIKQEKENTDESEISPNSIKHHLLNRVMSLQKEILRIIDTVFIEEEPIKNINIKGDIQYTISLHDGYLRESYLITNILSYCMFALTKLNGSEIKIGKCQNCGDYFVKQTKKEIYCDKLHPNGRTCKLMGPENKIKDDEAMSVYRRVYKNKNAMKSRNKHSPKAEERWLEWKKKSEEKRMQYENNEITLEEFKEWLENN